MTTPDDSRVTGFRADQLTGFRIGVTSDRRSEDLIDAFERRGGTVFHAPTLRIAHAAADDPIIEDTRAIIEQAPDVLLATTGYGIRRWFEVADAAGLGDDLTSALESVKILVRGPKARGGVRGAGLNDVGMSAVETTASLVTKTLDEYPPGLTIAVQLHGNADQPELERLRQKHTVLTVAPYRWNRVGSKDDKVQRLVELVSARQLDAVTFTSAPAVHALLAAAEAMGMLDQLVAALQSEVIAASVGPVTSAALQAVDVAPIQPDRYRMGALIRLVCEDLETNRVLRVETQHGTLELRGQVAVVAGNQVSLSATSVALLRRLMAVPGAVLSRSELSSTLPGIPDDHAMEVALSRLRQSLVVPGIVATVFKRGYRIAV